jgi:hypothetical protein
VDARGDDGLLRKDPLADESGQRPESGRRRTCRLGLHVAAQQGTRGARAQQGMREARALALYSHAGPGVRVSAIKPYEGFGDVDHTIKELMSP